MVPRIFSFVPFGGRSFFYGSVESYREYLFLFCSVCGALSLQSQSCARQIRIKEINIPEICFMEQSHKKLRKNSTELKGISIK